MSAEPTQESVRNWMRWALRADLRDREGCLVAPQTGEANLTRLAEAAAEHFDHDEWLDDPDHWVWDVAIDASDAEDCGVRL